MLGTPRVKFRKMNGWAGTLEITPLCKGKSSSKFQTIIFRSSGVVFTWKNDVWGMLTVPLGSIPQPGKAVNFLAECALRSKASRFAERNQT